MQPVEIAAAALSLAALAWSARRFVRGLRVERAVVRRSYARVLEERAPLLREYARLGRHDDLIRLYSDTLEELDSVRCQLRQRHAR